MESTAARIGAKTDETTGETGETTAGTAASEPRAPSATPGLRAIEASARGVRTPQVWHTEARIQMTVAAEEGAS